MSCEKSCKSKKHCGACCGGCCSQQLVLSSEEIKLLEQFAVIPFLPVACSRDDETPIYLEEGTENREIYSKALTALREKGLIRIDYDLPLTNFHYDAYRDYPAHGSMALTQTGQEMVEQLEME